MIVIFILPVTDIYFLLYKTFCLASSLILPSKRKERSQKNLGWEPQRKGNLIIEMPKEKGVHQTLL